MNNDIILPTLSCNRCNHEWIPRANKLPEVCPHCNSPYWNKERRQKMKKEKDDRDIGEITELAHDLHRTEKKK